MPERLAGERSEGKHARLAPQDLRRRHGSGPEGFDSTSMRPGSESIFKKVSPHPNGHAVVVREPDLDVLETIIASSEFRRDARRVRVDERIDADLAQPVHL